MIRRIVATGLLSCVVSLAGCAWFGSGPTPEEARAAALREPPDLRALEADDATTTPTPAPVATTATIERIDDELVLRVEDSFFPVWRMIGDALAEARFTVEDRDRTRGVYFIRYAVRTSGGSDSPGFFSRLAFWRDRESDDQIRPYRVTLTSERGTTRVAVYEDDGDPAPDSIAEPVLETLREHL